MGRRPRLGLCLGIGVVVGLPAWPGPARTSEKSRPRTTLEDESQRRALARALEGAARRLERKRCQGIFLDFKDASGHTLQHSLDAMSQDGASFLRDWVVFADGEPHAQCDDTRVLAFTQTGSRAVWICGYRFWREQKLDPSHVEVVLIHEALHALGLGENPPSSAAISRQILTRCGG